MVYLRSIVEDTHRTQSWRYASLLPWPAIIGSESISASPYVIFAPNRRTGKGPTGTYRPFLSVSEADGPGQGPPGAGARRRGWLHALRDAQRPGGGAKKGGGPRRGTPNRRAAMGFPARRDGPKRAATPEPRQPTRDGAGEFCGEGGSYPDLVPHAAPGTGRTSPINAFRLGSGKRTMIIRGFSWRP